MKYKKKQINKVILVVLFVVWIIFNGILLIRHELWRDEANVWLIARNLNPLQLFAEIKYQGHPCLWYLLVMPFAKSGLPFQTICVLSFLVMAVSAVFFLWKAPMNIMAKAICLLSPIWTYYYSVIARNYCLSALLLILLAWYYPKRNDKPWLYGIFLGLLVQTDTIVLATAGLISLMWLWEGVTDRAKKHSWKRLWTIIGGIWIPLVSFFLWVAQFMQVGDSPHFQLRALSVKEFVNEVKNYSYSILMRLTGQEKNFCTVAFLIFIVIGIMISVRLKDCWPMIVMIGSFLFQAVFSVLVYQLHIWHFISLCFVYVWMLWIWHWQGGQKKLLDKPTHGIILLAEFWLVILALCMFARWNSPDESSGLGNALHGLYSDGRNTADFISQNISREEILISTDVPMASTVLAYLGDYDCYYAGNGAKVTYADYSEEQEQRITLENLIDWATNNFPENQKVYLLTTDYSCLDETDQLENYECMYQSHEETARGEVYSIYRILIR